MTKHNTDTPTAAPIDTPNAAAKTAVTATPRRKTKFWILSDLHQEFSSCTWKPLPADIPDHDALILAGDTHSPTADAITYAEHLTSKPVFMVCGNHEFYGTVMKDELVAARKRAAQSPNVTLLENDTVTFHDIRILGCTLWTDFELFGRDYVEAAMWEAGRGMNDYNRVKRIDEKSGKTGPLRPQDTLEIHKASRLFLETELANRNDDKTGRTIIITHHAPHRFGLHPNFKKDTISVAFASDLTAIIETQQPDLWVFGHTHTACDFTIGKTRLISNARGYVGYEPRHPNYNQQLVIEV